MSLNGTTSTFIPFTISGLTDITSSNSNIGDATATSLTVTTATPNKIARFNGSQQLVSASVDVTDLVPYVGAIYDLNLGTQNLTASIITGIQIMLTGTAPTPARVAGYNTTGLYYLTTPATYLTNLTSDPQTQINAKFNSSGGTISGNVSLTGTNKITQAYNALTSDTTTLVNRQTLDSAISSASLLPLNNTWTGTNIFSNTVSLTSVSTATSSYTLGLNGSNQIIKYVPPTWIGGSVTSGYIPYASAANTLADSLLYKSGNNTGLGTTSPAGRFTIYATSAADADRLSSLVVDTYRAGIRLTSNGTAGCDWNFWVSTAGEAPPQDALCFYNQGTSKFRMVITRGGNLGIGTENPLCSLYVFGSATSGWAGQSYFGNATTGVIAGTYDNVAYIGGHNGSLSAWTDLSINASGGSVAIGRRVPLHKFHVEGTIAGQSILSLFPALNGGAGSNINITAGNGAFGSIEAYNTANTVKLPLCLNAYGGNVGVGTVTPAYTLDVAGSMRVTDGDNSRCVYGPNSTPGWGATLVVGAGPDVSGFKTAGITVTNGNLHLDAADGYAMYYGFYANSHGSGTSNPHLFYGGNYNYDSMPQNTGEYAQVCVMQGNRMLRSQAVAHQVVVNPSANWGPGANFTYAFYRYNGYTSQMIIGRLSYYQTGGAMAYYTIRIYSQSTGQVWYFPLNSFTNVANNHITVPIYAIFTSGYTTATGWFDIYVYNAGNCVTDGNDILDLHVITLPASNF